MAFYKNRPGHRAGDFLYLRMGSILWTKYIMYSYMLVKKGIYENLMNITQIMGEIWTLLLLWITLKISRLRHQNYFYFWIVKEDARSDCPAKFRYNCNTQRGNMVKSIWLEGKKLRLVLDYKISYKVISATYSNYACLISLIKFTCNYI